MKRIVIMTFITLMTFSVSAQEKDSKVAQTEKITPKGNSKINKAKFSVSMDCHSCQQKIEKNIAWEKGVKDLKVNLADKTVWVTYDTRKTNPEKLQEAFEKLNFTCKQIE